MKLRDFLKKFENLDLDTTEVNENGIIILPSAFMLGYELADFKKNPFGVDTKNFELFCDGVRDRKFIVHFNLNPEIPFTYNEIT